MQSFIRSLVTKNGRMARVVVGVALIVFGIVVPPETVGYVLVAIGVVMAAAGALDKCVIAPLFRLPFDGKELRKKVDN